MKKRIWFYGLTSALLFSSCTPVVTESSSQGRSVTESSWSSETSLTPVSSSHEDDHSSSSSVHTHSFGEWQVTKEPTCEEEGIEVRTCSECGEQA